MVCRGQSLFRSANNHEAWTYATCWSHPTLSLNIMDPDSEILDLSNYQSPNVNITAAYATNSHMQA